MKSGIKNPPLPILIVDDELQSLRASDVTLRSEGLDNILLCQDSREVAGLLARTEVEVVLLDLIMPRVPGVEILRLIRENMPETPVIIITGTDELQVAVECMKQGAFDYLLKPVARERFISAVGKAVQVRELMRENDLLKEHVLTRELEHPEAFAVFDTVSDRMQALFRYVESVSMSPEPVLITGETGTGKELMARCVHRLSRPDGPFVSVNAAGLDDNAFSDTLFGHRKGAFTGAMDARAGLIESASGGVLFLDEIGDLDTAMQVKLLRLLQEREYFPLGADVPKRSDARVVVATNRDLQGLMKEGKFRADLYFRLRHHHVHILPLRERLCDLPRLAARLLEDAAVKMGKEKPELPVELMPLLAAYGFPGNVRELSAMMLEAVSLSRNGMIPIAVFRAWLSGRHGMFSGDESGSGSQVSAGLSDCPPVSFGPVLPTLKQVQDILVKEALNRTGGQQSTAAAMLGITRQALNQRVRGGRG